MASDDFYSFSARQRLQQLDVNRAQALADLAAAKAGNDYDQAGLCVEELAKIEAAKGAIVNLHDQYVRSQHVPEPPQLTDEERHAKPLEKMNWDDSLALARTSQYGKNLSHDDPNVQAGYAEVMRRRQRGE